MIMYLIVLKILHQIFHNNWSFYLHYNMDYNYLFLKNVYVVGECISTDQGWVEGAISSVNNIIQSILENNII